MSQHSEATKRVIRDIQKDGHKITPDNVVRAWHVPMTSDFPTPPGAAGRLPNMYLEKGDSRSGLIHMCDKPSKVTSWIGVGIPAEAQREKLPVLVEAATTAGRHIATQGRKNDRHVMSTYVEGRVMNTAITVANNGYIVGANPRSKSDIKFGPNDPGEVSSRTMQNLYSYPLNCPDRRCTDEAKKSQEMERKEPAVPKAKTSYLGRFFK
ncbi:hypothetical protein CFIO01_03798 [Colletotrichum fioriniae PJ7]|uniref:Uncharacterized protein n=1 Tax=Colletotrichum fioriniae PJ7 TaxID=1445577 RepID=A0A010RU35_9PEZI|nr:hypothetical protein CFIO01_03798 [Colletotrichum fioriniae PJ7]